VLGAAWTSERSGSSRGNVIEKRILGLCQGGMERSRAELQLAAGPDMMGWRRVPDGAGISCRSASSVVGAPCTDGYLSLFHASAV
jgi:hypothetical protein